MASNPQSADGAQDPFARALQRFEHHVAARIVETDFVPLGVRDSGAGQSVCPAKHQLARLAGFSQRNVRAFALNRPVRAAPWGVMHGRYQGGIAAAERDAHSIHVQPEDIVVSAIEWIDQPPERGVGAGSLLTFFLAEDPMIGIAFRDSSSDHPLRLTVDVRDEVYAVSFRLDAGPLLLGYGEVPRLTSEGDGEVGSAAKIHLQTVQEVPDASTDAARPSLAT